MNVGQKSARRMVASSGPLSRDTVCISCRHLLAYPQRRNAATAAATLESSPLPPLSTSHHTTPGTASKSPEKGYALLASPVLSRPPLLTRDLTAFEESYYLYQKRLNERLAIPFSRYFYYKKGTPADEEWKRKAKGRNTPAKDIGVYSGYGKEAWNDEVMVGSKIAQRESIYEALIKDSEGKSIVPGAEEAEKKAASVEENAMKEMAKVEVERPMPRLTEADTTNNTKSLNRKLDKSLYLLIKNKDGRWRFPEDRVYGRENLHQAAERVLVQAAGINMNTWLVGNQPIGHYIYNYPRAAADAAKKALPAGPNGGRIATIEPNHMVPTSLSHGPIQREEFGEKLFFMKGRIMAGQVEMAKNEYGDQDFAWLSKSEIEKFVTAQYWSSIRNMLTER